MPIVAAHIKFSLGTTFLDNFFTAEDERLPGESIEDGVLRVRNHLVNAIEILKRKVELDSALTEQILNDPYLHPPKHSHVIDYRAKEALEIAIDNATTISELHAIKEECGKAGLLSEYVNKFNFLNNKTHYP